jgi:hypothetical protein
LRRLFLFEVLAPARLFGAENGRLKRIGFYVLSRRDDPGGALFCWESAGMWSEEKLAGCGFASIEVSLKNLQKR